VTGVAGSLNGVTLQLGPHLVDPPVVLAPMAGITNVGFRQLCREHGDGIYVCEMITTRALIERNPKTLRMVAFQPDESPRSLQLYGVDPSVTAAAVRMIVEENLADHIDLNFGCPVPKVTRKGGGSALPWRRRLFGQIVAAAVHAADGLPVTVKMRKGIDDDHLTYVEAGLIAQDAGAAWVALHGRTAAQRYAGEADWAAIAALKRALEIPVLGNGDIWEADDALRMVEQTGVDGVVVGRGCLGRPWLFADLQAAFRELATGTGGLGRELATGTGGLGRELATGTGGLGRELATGTGRQSGGRADRVMPTLGEVAAVMRRHAELLTESLGTELDGCTDFRKHVAWYLKGFPVGSELRRALAMISSLSELDDLLGKLDADEPYPVAVLGQPRGRTNSPGKVHLPDGWLASRDDCAVPAGAELDDSGG
jgi:nifR3 family TIM-barrel protein